MKKTTPMSATLAAILLMGGCSGGGGGSDAPATADNIGTKPTVTKPTTAEPARFCLPTYALQNHHALTPCSLDGQFGFKGADENMVIPAQFDIAYEFNQHNLARVTQRGEWFYIDQTGEKITTAYDWLYEFNDGLARFFKNNQYGYIDTKGQEIIPAKYQNGADFHQGLAVVSQNQQYGLIDKNGNTILDFKYTQLDYLAPNTYRAKTATSDIIIDQNGNQLSDYPNYKNPQWVSGEREKGTQIFWVLAENKQFFIDQKQQVLTPKYDHLRPVGQNLAIALKRDIGKKALIRTDGTQVTDFKYQFKPDSEFHQGYIQVQLSNNRYTFLSENGTQLPQDYQDLRDFSEGLAAVQNKGLWGFINTRGDMVIQPQFTMVNPFANAVTWGKTKDGKWVLIGKTGKVLIQTQYTQLDDIGSGVWAGKLAEKYYAVNRQNNLNHTAFDKITPLQNGVAKGWNQSQNTYQLIHQNGISQQSYLEIKPLGSARFAGKTSDAQWALLDEKGAQIGTAAYLSLGAFADNLAVAQTQTGQWQLINPQGKMRLALPENAQNGVNFLGVGKAGQRLFNTAGEFITSAQQSHVAYIAQKQTPVGNGLLAMTTPQHQYGYINSLGQAVIPINLNAAGGTRAFTGRQPYAQVLNQKNQTYKINGAGRCIADCP